MKKFLIVICFLSLPTFAAVSPLSINVFPPVEFPPSDFNVAGFRASLLWGSQRDVRGIDLGFLGNITSGTFAGASASGLFNITHGTTTAVLFQAAGAVNWNSNKTRVLGIQLAGLVNYNEAESAVSGIQAALLANLSAHTNIYGFQLGLYNKAQNVYGIQFGLINVAASLHGIQIGLLNFNSTGLFAVSPLLNAGF